MQALARGIAEAGRGEHAHVFRLGGWSERMLDWALTHPDFKTQLFRLVDVFPACTSDGDVLRHVDEYFAGIPVPHALDLGIDLAEHVPFGAQVTAAVVRRNIRRMARQFIAGETPEAAVPRLDAACGDAARRAPSTCSASTPSPSPRPITTPAGSGSCSTRW